jgi:hydrogenase nickel incorporation protein HypB
MDAWLAWLDSALGEGGSAGTDDEVESLRRRVAELEAQLQEARLGR